MVMTSSRAVMKELFPRILCLWKNAPTHHNWAMEKLMEIFNQEIAPDPTRVHSVGFTDFVKGLFENNELICFPDFVLNNVALMCGQALICGATKLQDLEEPGMKLIRHPLEYWLVNKGHSVDVTFRVFTQFVKHRVMLPKLNECSFEIAQAVSFSVASPHNYTRRSARTFFVHAVKFAFQEDPVLVENVEAIKSNLRATITNTLKTFFERLTTDDKKDDGCVEMNGENNKHSASHNKAEIKYIIRLCKLILDSTKMCQEWFQIARHCGIYDAALNACVSPVARRENGTQDLLLDYGNMIIQALNRLNDDEEKQKYVEKLLELLESLYLMKSASAWVDAMSLAIQVLTGGITLQTYQKNMFLEMCFLPLFVLVDSAPLYFTSPSGASSLTNIKTVFDKGNASSACCTSTLLKEAVKNMYTILNRKMELTEEHTQLVAYLSLKSMDAIPSSVRKPLLLPGGYVRDVKVAQFLEQSFSNLQKTYAEGKGQLPDVQVMVKALMDYPQLKFFQIEAAMECYSSLLNQDRLSIDISVFTSVLTALNMKMVDMDADVQEAAVKWAGKLLLKGVVDLSSPDASKSLSSVWQCIHYRSDGVVAQVLEFLSAACLAGASTLDAVLSHLSISKNDIVMKAETFLLSASCAEIKPPAFRVLSLLCNRKHTFNYARSSLTQCCFRLHDKVLDYIKIMFDESCKQGSPVQKERLKESMELLSEGWGELLMNKDNSVEISNSRQVYQILVDFHTFQMHDLVLECTGTVITEFAGVLVTALELNDDCIDKTLILFDGLCNNVLLAHGHSAAILRNDAGIGEEPSSKRLKLNLRKMFHTDLSDDTVRILCHVLDTENVPEATIINMVKNYRHGLSGERDDEIIDSTNELPPYELDTQPCLMRQIIEKCLSVESIQNKEFVISLVTWLVFREVLHRIKPNSLNIEAERSTDEYKRNSSLLLHDLHKVLDKTYTSLREDFDMEVKNYYIGKQSGINSLAEQVNDDAESKSQLVMEIVQHAHEIDKVDREINSLFHLVLKRRTSVYLPQCKPSNSQFILDFFQERLNAFRCPDVKMILTKDGYPSTEGFKLILAEFIEHTTPLEDNGDGSTMKDVKISELLYSGIDDKCEYFFKLKEAVLKALTEEECFFLQELFRKFRLYDLHNMCEQMKTTCKYADSSHILNPLKAICCKLIVSTFQNADMNKMGLALCRTCADSMKYTLIHDSDDDFDDGNDPCALDCV